MQLCFGNCHRQIGIFCNLVLQCGASYLFYFEQSEEQMQTAEINALLCDKSDDCSKQIIEKRTLVQDVRCNHRKQPYEIENVTFHKLTEIVFYHD